MIVTAVVCVLIRRASNVRPGLDHLPVSGTPAIPPHGPASRPPISLALPVPQAPTPVPLEKLTTTAPQKLATNDAQQLVALVEPAVVTIAVTKTAFDATGSGFVVDASGAIATNYHVIEGARAATVIFRDGTRAKVIGFSAILPNKDLAILRVDCSNFRLRALAIAKTIPAQGERVLTFGAPNGLAGSVSDGIVSAVRSGTELQHIFTKQAYSDEGGYDTDMIWIQTTAPISHGNSGGPLVDTNANVVGVNTLTRSEGQDLNFAVSSVYIAKLIGAGSLPVHSLADLPKSRDDIRAEMLRKRAAEEALAAEAAQKAAAAKQAELADLAGRITTLNSEIAAVETEGKELVGKRGEMFSAADNISRSARQTAGAIAYYQNIINSQPIVANSDSAAAVQDAMNHLVALRQEYANYQAKYNELDASARDLKSKIESLANTREQQLYDLRCLQVKVDRLLHGITPAAAKDAAIAKAWQSLTRGMTLPGVEAVLGRANDSSSGPGGHGQVYEYKYLECGTSIEIVGSVRFLNGLLVQWDEPRWAK